MRNILFSVVVIGIFLIGTTVYSFKNEDEKYLAVYDTVDFITHTSFEGLVSSGEDFYVYISIPTCDECNIFEPKVINLINNNKLESPIFYLDAKDLIENEEKWEEFKELYDVLHTPVMARYSKGKLVDKVEWTSETGISIKDVDSWIKKQ
ncbi:hypothetical protein KSU66_15890 [Sporosarcina sp. G11-34]|nr:hypothetical protein [Sporosarcina sp. G11-34]